MHVSSWLLRATIFFWTWVKQPSNSTVRKLPRDRWDKQHKEESAQPLLTNIRSTETLWLHKYLSCKLWITCPKVQTHQCGTVNTYLSPWEHVLCRQWSWRAEHPLYSHAALISDGPPKQQRLDGFAKGFGCAVLFCLPTERQGNFVAFKWYASVITVMEGVNMQVLLMKRFRKSVLRTEIWKYTRWELSSCRKFKVYFQKEVRLASKLFQKSLLV